MGLELQIILVALMVAFACLLPGNFLVLKKISMVSDAISHSVILGIVLGYFLVKNLYSPFLFLGAALSAFIMFFLTEKLIQSKQVKREAAVALIFPLLFSIAIILINVFASNIHLDEDTVITGGLAFIPLVGFDAFNLFTIPKALVISFFNFIVNLLLTIFFFKELSLVSLEEDYASDLGLGYKKINYGLVFITSLTAVCSFEAVGSILVIGFFILPPSISFLWAKSLKKMLMLSFLVASMSVIVSYIIAYLYNFSIAGTILIVLGFFLLLSVFIAPKSKWVAFRKIKKNV